jgi:hypothetical protein
MRGSVAAAGSRPSLRGTVLPGKGRRRPCESPIAPRQPRRLAIVGPTAPPARDWSLMLVRQQERTAVQSP